MVTWRVHECTSRSKLFCTPIHTSNSRPGVGFLALAIGHAHRHTHMRTLKHTQTRRPGWRRTANRCRFALFAGLLPAFGLGGRLLRRRLLGLCGHVRRGRGRTLAGFVGLRRRVSRFGHGKCLSDERTPMRRKGVAASSVPVTPGTSSGAAGRARRRALMRWSAQARFRFRNARRRPGGLCGSTTRIKNG